MKNNAQEEFVFKAIPLWEVIATFCVMLLLVFGITEYIIIPLSKGNTTMQTQFIVFLGTMLLIAEFVFHLKRSKNIHIYTNNEQIAQIKKNNLIINSNELTNISLTKFIFEKSLSYILIINKKLYLIYKEEALSFKPDKENIALCKIKARELKRIIEQSKLKKNSFLNLIPNLINAGFYLLLVIAFSLFAFVMIAIFTDNTHWFNYFR